ncbi:MAG: ATP-dependent metallopeptidase FtsH/Yme1/Tma family protein [Pseudomonadota bacterium]
MEKRTQINIWYFLAALLLLLLFQQWWSGTRQVETVPYSEFDRLLKDGRLQEIAIGDKSIRGTLKEPRPDGTKYIHAVRVDLGYA